MGTLTFGLVAFEVIGVVTVATDFDISLREARTEEAESSVENCGAFHDHLHPTLRLIFLFVGFDISSCMGACNSAFDMAIDIHLILNHQNLAHTNRNELEHKHTQKNELEHKRETERQRDREREECTREEPPGKGARN